MVEKEKRSESRDPGEAEQKKAVALGLTDAPDVAAQPENIGKCPTCGRDHVNVA